MACSDGVDNDNDGRVDCRDVSCIDFCGGRRARPGLDLPTPGLPEPAPREIEDEAVEGEQPVPPPPVFGMGTAIGAGWASAVVTTVSGESETGSGLSLNLGSLELEFFLPRAGAVDMSIDVSLVLTDTIIVSFGIGGFYTELAMFYSIYVGQRRVRGVFSLGAGMSILAAEDIFAIAPEVPARIAVEFLTRSRGLGFRLGARPFFTAAYASGFGDEGWGIGGGVIGEFSFSYYYYR
jgi:hypothetical protein